MLETEIKFFRKNQEDWIKKYPGKFVLVKGEKLIGVYTSEDEALAEGARHFGLTSFLIRNVNDDDRVVHIPALTLGIINADPANLPVVDACKACNASFSMDEEYVVGQVYYKFNRIGPHWAFV